MTFPVIPVILCGGSGTRLWPASREKTPKQFLKLAGENTLLQDTVKRALDISGALSENLVVVTHQSQDTLVREQLAEIGIKSAHILAEPHARNTAAAIALAGHYVAANFGTDAFLWVLPSDHFVGDIAALGKACQLAQGAADGGYLVTFGIKPTRPETGYGYILQGSPLENPLAHKVDKFVEKPDLKTAQSYLDAGTYLWNSGMFFFRASTLLEQFKEYSPAILSKVSQSMTAGGKISPDAYLAIPSEPFDKAVMEKSGHVAVVPCDPEWSDIGSWQSLWELLEKDENGNSTEGNVALSGVQNTLIKAKDRLIAVAGLKDIVVIDTGDAILIADKNNGEAIKALVTGLPKKDR
ncbi:MAG TPA: mannose-1-phosphate guanylyltransferase/mannose-6-phosphate isomerase [Rhodospirillaceae bacterium]|nr:mannose-1-phosphate guanylyltransferase/mannose-6-phosphate isomerase [Rhodospirillaceae bacterium]